MFLLFLVRSFKWYIWYIIFLLVVLFLEVLLMCFFFDFGLSLILLLIELYLEFGFFKFDFFFLVFFIRFIVWNFLLFLLCGVWLILELWGVRLVLICGGFVLIVVSFNVFFNVGLLWKDVFLEVCNGKCFIWLFILIIIWFF